jgi:inner membrane transporter RhtA
MAGAVTQYLGAAVAVQFFDRLGTPAVAWLRVLWAAVALLAWRRPRLGGRSRRARTDLVVFGLALGAMNLCFYLAIARLPLGTAVAIEFSGPIAVAAAGSRRPRDLAAVGLASVGVLLLADLQWAGNAAGVGFALASAALWAGYIVWGRRVGSSGAGAGLDGLALATAAGALVVAPVGLAGLVSHGPADRSLVVAVVACAVVALCSNVVPYALDQVVLARVPAARFALLSTLLPVTAAAVGAVALAQWPAPAELAGTAAVAGALLLRPGRDPAA